MLDTTEFGFKNFKSSITSNMTDFVRIELSRIMSVEGKQIDLENIKYQLIDDSDKIGIVEYLTFTVDNRYFMARLEHHRYSSFLEISIDDFKRDVIDASIARNEYLNNIINVGDTVKVVKGRTLAHGTTGVITAIKPYYNNHKHVADYVYFNNGTKINIDNVIKIGGAQ